MQQLSISIRFFLVICLVNSGSCAQHRVQTDASGTAIYAGSTPCDSLIRVQIGIPANAKCDFIKWYLKLDDARTDSFHLRATYGESKPNTLGFVKDAEFQAQGKYLYTIGAIDNPKTSILNLISPQFKSPVLLIVMDSNILHFADRDKQFLVGNGGWGYVLNSIKNP